MVMRLCRVDANPPCGWDAHNFKHFPFSGMAREHTRQPNPARYLPDFQVPQIQTLETETARQSARPCERLPAKSEYLREMQQIIGWDLGQDATLSFVECTGGEVARAFHGRPMCLDNPKARKGRAP